MAKILMLVVMLLSPPGIATGYQVEGLQQFSVSDQHKIHRWLMRGEQAVSQTFGALPFVTHIHLYLRNGTGPVPWAHTWKHERKSLHLYIDTRYELDEFIQDWTLYHEWSHLALPYLGEQHRWWAEGFASYMQYHLMAQVLTLNETPEALIRRRWQAYQEKFDRNRPIGVQAQQLIENQQYPPAYWAGALYFLQVQQQLETGRLITIVKSYVQHHYRSDHNLDELLAVFDHLAGAPVFRQNYDRMMGIVAVNQ